MKIRILLESSSNMAAKQAADKRVRAALHSFENKGTYENLSIL